MWRGSTRRPRRALCSTWPRGRSPPRRAARCRRMRGPSPCSIWPATTASSRRSGRSITTSSGGPRRRFVEGSLDGNAKTDADITFVPYILTPCFPSYPSNHGSGSNSAAEILRRVYGAGGHDITMANPAVPGVTLPLHQVQPDHGRHQRRARLRRHPFSLRSGCRRRSGTRHRRRIVYKHNLRRAKHSDHDDEDEHDGHSHHRD